MKILRLLVLMTLAVCPLSVFAADPADEYITSAAVRKAFDALNSSKHAEALRLLAGQKPAVEELAEYYYVLGRAKIAEQKPLDAVEHLMKSYQYAPKGGLKELSLLDRADLYLRIGYFHEARSVYAVFIRTFPESKLLGRVYQNYAKSLAETGSLKDAITYYEKAGNTPDVMIGKANTLHRLGMIREADKIYVSVLTAGAPLISASDETLYYLGENFRQAGRPDDALKYLKKVQSEKFRARALVSLGLIAIQQGKAEEASKMLNSALKSDDRTVKRQALLNLAEVELKEGKIQEARARLQEIRLNYPYGRTYDEALLKLSGILRTEGEYEEAAKILARLASDAFFRKEALEGLEKILKDAASKDRERFISLWKLSGPLLLDASRETFLLDSGENLKPAGKPFVDVMLYLAKYGSERAKAESLAALCGYYLEKGDSVKAGEYLGRLKTIKTAGEEVTRLEAKAAFTGKDYKTASEKLLQLKKLQQSDMAMLGDIVAVSDIPKATVRYEKLVRETGGDEKAYIRLADIMHGQGKNDEAVSYYRLALARNPKNDWALYRIGILTEGAEAEEAIKKMGSQDQMLAKLAEARLRELDLAKKGIEPVK